jgi:hypothetical protein
VAFIGAIAGIINKVDSNLTAFSQITQAIKAALGTYQNSYTQSLVALNTTFNLGSSSDLPTLLPTNPGSGEAFPSAFSPNDPFAGSTPAQIQAQQSPALSASQAIDQIAAIRTQLNELIALMETAEGGQGSLLLYEDIRSLRQSGIAIQQALELGLQTSNASVRDYTTPILMTVREVCFANGIPVDRSQEIVTLNPTMLSANYIAKDTTLQVPVT